MWLKILKWDDYPVVQYNHVFWGEERAHFSVFRGSNLGLLYKSKCSAHWAISLAQPWNSLKACLRNRWLVDGIVWTSQSHPAIQHSGRVSFSFSTSQINVVPSLVVTITRLRRPGPQALTVEASSYLAFSWLQIDFQEASATCFCSLKF